MNNCMRFNPTESKSAGESKAKVLKLVSRSRASDAVRSADTEQELLALLKMARAGELVGLAYVGLRPGREKAIVGAAGRPRSDPEAAAFGVQRLNLELLRLG